MKKVMISLVLLLLSAPAIAFADAGGLPALEKRVQSLESQEISLQNQINNIQLKPGPQGPAGSVGPTGATGATGPQDHRARKDYWESRAWRMGW
jgi:hypothetical protein